MGKDSLRLGEKRGETPEFRKGRALQIYRLCLNFVRSLVTSGKRILESLGRKKRLSALPTIISNSSVQGYFKL